MRPRALVLALGMGLLGAAAFGQNVRGLVVEELRVRADAGFEKTVGIALDEMAVLKLEGDTRFLRGVRLELQLSNLLKQHFDSFGLAVYRRVAPEPRKGISSYRGDRVFFQPLPYLNRVRVLLPVSPGPEEEGDDSGEGAFRLAAPLSPGGFPGPGRHPSPDERHSRHGGRGQVLPDRPAGSRPPGAGPARAAHALRDAGRGPHRLARRAGAQPRRAAGAAGGPGAAGRAAPPAPGLPAVPGGERQLHGGIRQSRPRWTSSSRP